VTGVRAIVFDFDGVIVESADVKTDAFVELFAAHGSDVQARVRAHHLANTGISRFVKFAWIHEHVLGTPLTDDGSRELGERFSTLVLDKVLAAPMVAGARQALDALAPRFPLFVASGTPQDELDLIVDRRGLRALFREVHGTPREKPAILRDVMARHGLAPGDVVFVGDGESDYKAAVATGVGFIARDTPPLHDRWVELGVTRLPDLVDLPATVSP
jgi:phosphoglycolate phosphatase-like HAD superfamily hydrolase